MGTIVHDTIYMSELYTKTIEMLESTTKPMSVISKETDVGLRWLYQLKAGKFSDPGVNKIQRIHDYLSDQIVGSV